MESPVSDGFTGLHVTGISTLGSLSLHGFQTTAKPEGSARTLFFTAYATK